ncbi:hypothetical protein [Dermabacter hominis]|uniref:hypothetical protein n=1 Tax=Dermabacter hominis TaxID=36740 RepID=UPI0021A7F767|nr:hypothetical protein [Dermabacter hominis]MCT1716059.1 hypothetical protein [Dermabacter hominis]
MTLLTFRSSALSPVAENKFESIKLAGLLDEGKLAGGMRAKLISLDGLVVEG